MLLWTLIYKYLFKSLLSRLLCLCPELELLDQVAILHLIFWGTAILFFHSGYSILCAHWECTGVPVSPLLCQYLFGIFVFFLVRVIIMVWRGISLFFVFQSAFIGLSTSLTCMQFCVWILCWWSDTYLYKYLICICIYLYTYKYYEMLTAIRFVNTSFASHKYHLLLMVRWER